jgi:hypothetical protein
METEKASYLGNNFLKGQCHEIFDLRFSSSYNYPTLGPDSEG